MESKRERHSATNKMGIFALLGQSSLGPDENHDLEPQRKGHQAGAVVTKRHNWLGCDFTVGTEQGGNTPFLPPPVLLFPVSMSHWQVSTKIQRASKGQYYILLMASIHGDTEQQAREGQSMDRAGKSKREKPSLLLNSDLFSRFSA